MRENNIYMEVTKMIDSYNKAKEVLKRYNQNHIINFIDTADLEVKDKLIKQVLNIDFEELKELYKKTSEKIKVDLKELEPISGVNPDKITKEELLNYEKIGIDIIKSNKFAVCTMAGGQGTRLRTFWP